MKIFGISLTIFIFYILWIFLKPKEGLNPLIMEASNIDSIEVYKSGDTTIMVTVTEEITTICNEVKKCQIVDPELKTDSGFIDLTFYVKNKQKPTSVTIIYNKYDGILIHANDLYYKNDSLNVVTIALLKRN